LVSGPNRANLDRVSQEMGEPVQMADAGFHPNPHRSGSAAISNYMGRGRHPAVSL
jgi:hypothetical protein